MSKRGKVTVYLKNISLEVDRQAQQNWATFWKPLSSSWEIQGTTVVAVDVPEKREYIHNVPENNLMYNLGQDVKPESYDPILTPAGFAYIQNEMEQALRDLAPKVETETPEEEDWDDELADEEFEEIE